MKKRYMWLIMIITIVIWIVWFVNFHPVFWGKATWIGFSPNYKDGKFQNIENVAINTQDWSIFSMIYDFLFNGSPEKVPKITIPTKKIDNSKLSDNSFVWLGHSTVLMDIDQKKIITDPVFYEASPLLFWWKPFKYSHTPKIEDLPNIDVVVISHDHYDHLDYKTITEIDSKVGEYLVPLWVGSHLKKWWVKPEKITEFDWYDSKNIEGIDFNFTPAQHFSGRGITDRASTLWWWWAIKWKENNVYFSWDTWYFKEFKKIWEKFWPFDIAFLENGAYNKNWKDIHMMPEEAVMAGLDLKAKTMMPIHWWKFDLSLHSWYEPIERVTKAAKNKNIEVFHPQVWEIFEKNNLPKEKWWSELIKK